MITKEERLLLLLKWAPYLTNFDIDEYIEMYKQWYIDQPGQDMTCVEYINQRMENALRPASNETIKSILGRV